MKWLLVQIHNKYIPSAAVAAAAQNATKWFKIVCMVVCAVATDCIVNMT